MVLPDNTEAANIMSFPPTSSIMRLLCLAGGACAAVAAIAVFVEAFRSSSWLIGGFAANLTVISYRLLKLGFRHKALVGRQSGC